MKKGFFMKDALTYCEIRWTSSVLIDFLTREFTCGYFPPGGWAWGPIWDRCFAENVGFGKIGQATGAGRALKWWRFDVLRVAMGSYTVESKRIASRKLLKQVPGLQDIKNRPKWTEIINKKNTCFAGFLAVFFALFFQLGRRHGALARDPPRRDGRLLFYIRSFQSCPVKWSIVK